MLLFYLPAGCGFLFSSYEHLFISHFETWRLVAGYFFINMSRMHLSDAEAGVTPLFPKNGHCSVVSLLGALFVEQRWKSEAGGGAASSCTELRWRC